jgi:hypothetical protein
VTDVTGLIDTSFGTMMREPVTTTSWTIGAGAGAAGAVCASAAGAAIVLAAAASANRTLDRRA